MRAAGSLVATQGATRFRRHPPLNLSCLLADVCGKGVIGLAISLSVVAVLGVAVFLLCRYAGLRVLHAAICVMLGFYLASSRFAPAIAHITTSLFRML